MKTDLKTAGPAARGAHPAGAGCIPLPSPAVFKLLGNIQTELETLYQFSINQRVENFTVETPASRETLLVRYQPQAFVLGLLLDPKLLNFLERNDPFQQLALHNLNAFCASIEGVSHFLCFLQKHREEKPTTRLELEIQAEVDKFLLANQICYRQQREIPDFLFTSLFENFSLISGLQPSEQARYREANHLSAKFCSYLDQHFVRQHRWDDLQTKARQFYHLDHWAKLRLLTP